MHPETTMNTRLLTKLTCVMFTTSTAYNEQRLSSGGVQVFKDREAYSVKLHSILSSFVKSGTIKKCLRSMYYSMSLRISPECYWKWPLWDLKRQQTSHLNCVFVSEFWFTCKLLLRHKTRDQMGSQQPRHPSTRSCSDPWLNRSHYYVFPVSSTEVGMDHTHFGTHHHLWHGYGTIAMTDTCTTTDRLTYKVPTTASVLLLLLKVSPGT